MPAQRSKQQCVRVLCSFIRHFIFLCIFKRRNIRAAAHTDQRRRAFPLVNLVAHRIYQYIKLYIFKVLKQFDVKTCCSSILIKQCTRAIAIENVINDFFPISINRKLFRIIEKQDFS